MGAKELLANSLVTYFIKNKVATSGTIPQYRDMLNAQTTKLDDIFTPSSIPSIDFKSTSSLSTYIRTIEDIKLMLSSVKLSVEDIIKEHRRLSNTYQDICIRIDNEAKSFRQAINSMLSYSCFFVDTNQANQADASIVGKIGKYITLPFFISGVQMYNDNIFIRPISTSDIVFSNLETITSMPFQDWPSLKLSGPDSVAEVTLNMTISKTTANAIYLKFLNNVMSCTLTLYNSNAQVWQGTFETDEILANFLPVEFDLLSIRLQSSNPNTSKPLAIQLRSFEIFKRIQFAKHGTFQSKPLFIEEASRVSYIGSQYADLGNQQYTRSQPMLSVSTDSTDMSYNIVKLGEFINISYFKYKHSSMFNLANYGVTEGQDAYVGEQVLGDNRYFKVPILSTDSLWDMNYRYASIFHGLNTEYATTSPSYYSFFENWTKAGNYYKTMLLNYEDNIFVDIGQKTCIFNGRLVTGKIKIPSGVSTIEVHSKDIDFKFGNKIADARFNGVIKKSAVYSDELFPFNFAYMFAGLPDYADDSSDTMSIKADRRFDIASATTIFLDEPFLPLTMTIVDAEGTDYKLQLTKGVSTPGTYSVEPYSGKIRVYPNNPTTLTVRYRKASLIRRPCGILFNRLLTFIPLKALIGLPDKDSTLFSIDGTPSSKYLLIQKINDMEINHSYIMYNKFSDKIYSAVKIDFNTDNQSLSPIISDVFITTG